MIRLMLAEAWHAMSANRLRTLLTMLGMVIGVAAVILMLAIGQGVQYTVQESINSMGSNLFIVMSGSTTSGGLRTGSGGVQTLTVTDAEAIDDLNGVLNAAPVSPGTAQVIYGGNNWSTQIYGATANYLDVRAWPLAEGYPIADSDVRSATRIALIGQTVAKNLFVDENPIGKTIRIKQNPFLVVGLLSNKGQALDGRDQDDCIIVPLTTAQRKLFGAQFQGTVRFIMVQANSREGMPAVEKSIQSLLRQRHRLRDNAEDDFTIRNLTAVANTAAETTRVLSMLLGAIASVSLIVGGIGIMNIMLVSVTERTREIGIRMAIGARQRDILSQFLLEAIIISVIGCVIGVILGVSGAILANQAGQVPVVITGSAILIAFSVAASVGVFFGFYPARKAAQLNPIEALRYQ